ncbi:RmlC-like cupin [Myriangium duriaei CBS 260.36]|uniref:RmlC-like cupin n=1 Tax=Myriangium duriaei CBS 260.36 TaxID=1168546 RepID=A0A9P4J228_9PEZI|nr:RmlC-like cupin [Myriangium duriaei CBS 260.36]
MPSVTHVRSPDPSKASGAQTGGMLRANAISGEAKINASIMTAKPHTKSDIHHHGDQDTIIYALRGTGSVVTDQGNTTTRLAPGDFCLIPAGVEHLEQNDTDEEVVWVIHRSGSKADVVNLDNWSA